MVKYVEKNVNPKGRKTCDCSTRALVSTLGITFVEALRAQYEVTVDTGYFVSSRENTDKVLKKFGYVKMKQPRKSDGKKYQVGEMDEVLTEQEMQEGVFIIVAHHCTCITKGVVIDTWDCRGKTVGNYWVKTLQDGSVNIK